MVNLATRLALCASFVAGTCPADEPNPASDMFRGSQGVTDRNDKRPTMSLETLRGCVALEYETRGLRRDFDSAKSNLERAERDFRSLDVVVQSRKQSLDLTDAREVDDYNEKVAEQGRALDAFNASVEPHNRLVDAIDAATARFNDECTRPYLERDMRVVRMEREAAIRAELETSKKP